MTGSNNINPIANEIFLLKSYQMFSLLRYIQRGILMKVSTPFALAMHKQVVILSSVIGHSSYLRPTNF